MATIIQVCNMAVGHLGESGNIASIAPPEGSKYAEDCAQFYAIARDLVLVDAKDGFHFNTKRAALALQGTAPFSWAFSYAWPGDCLHPVAVIQNGDTRDENPQPFTVETAGTRRYLYTDVEDAVLRYTYAQTDLSLWTTPAALALSYRLAALLAGPIIKGSKGVEAARGMMAMYRDALATAMIQDASARHDNTYKDFTPDALQARR